MANPVQVAAKLYDVRDGARAILGSKFREAMDDYGHVLRVYAEKKSLPILASALEIIKDSPEISDTARMVLVAAAVEIIDPSKVMEAGRG